MNRRRFVVAVLCTALGASACSTVLAGSPTHSERAPATGRDAATGDLPPAATTTFSDCTSQFQTIVAGRPGSERPLRWECGTMPVPLDYDVVGGTELSIHVVRGRLDSQHDRIGALFVNPGGPGISGTDLALNLSLTMPIDVLERFDLVGFDPRGVNFSSPVECVPDAYKDELYDAEPYVRDDAEFQVQVDIAETIAGMCYDRYGDELGLINTMNTARDMDQLRESLGESRLTYLGYSYGTTLGSAYAELFPENVRALVLDAATDPTLGERAATEAQARGFESAFDAFAAECVATGACAAGENPQQTVLHVLEDARQSPLPIPGGDGRTVSVGLVLTGVLSSLYSQEMWPALAAAIGLAESGDGTGLVQLADSYTGRQADGTYSNLLEANLSVNCADSAETFTDVEIRALIEEMRGLYPIFGAPIAANVLSCDRWQAPRHPLPIRNAGGAQPIMVIGTTNDPATPYTGAQAMTGELDSGFLLTWIGEGHTAYPKTPCITGAVNAYLIDLRVPTNQNCPAN
ncbi:MAG: alpha/beta hydrolase [Geodermatophilaceae bacterium]